MNHTVILSSVCKFYSIYTFSVHNVTAYKPAVIAVTTCICLLRCDRGFPNKTGYNAYHPCLHIAFGKLDFQGKSRECTDI